MAAAPASVAPDRDERTAPDRPHVALAGEEPERIVDGTERGHGIAAHELVDHATESRERVGRVQQFGEVVERVLAAVDTYVDDRPAPRGAGVPRRRAERRTCLPASPPAASPAFSA